jgi:predicted nucleic acid-binding protein
MILLDANVLLEMLIAGGAKKEAVYKWMEKNTEDFCITMLTVHLILHFEMKDRLNISDIKTFLADYPKVALLPEDYVAAVGILKDKDHEDALQLAIAERIGCTSIVTLDKKFSEIYKDRFNFIVPATVG